MMSFSGRRFRPEWAARLRAAPGPKRVFWKPGVEERTVATMTRNAHVVLAATLLLASACAPSCRAQVSAEDRALAAHSGLAESDIQAIRSAVGVPIPETPPAPRPSSAARRIVSIDATSLKPNGHVLVVEQRAGCVAIHVMKRDATGFAEVWSLDKMPSGGFAATGNDGICSMALGRIHI